MHKPKGYRTPKTQDKIDKIFAFMKKYLKIQQTVPTREDIALFLQHQYPENNWSLSNAKMYVKYYLKLMANDGLIVFRENRRPIYKINLDK